MTRRASPIRPLRACCKCSGVTLWRLLETQWAGGLGFGLDDALRRQVHDKLAGAAGAPAQLDPGAGRKGLGVEAQVIGQGLAGSKIYFPVYVKGGGLSVGDLHFSQGDGEITFCGAIEMAGWIHLRVNLIKDGMAKYGIKNPIFKPSPIAPKYDDYLIFEGISVDEYGEQHYLDVHVAYRQACLNAINYLTKFGYSKAQAYAILGCAPVQGHISGVVDIPNACATLWLPTDIFDFDVNPTAEGPTKKVTPGTDVPLSKDK